MGESEAAYDKDDLIQLARTRELFIGIDSDGCVFDTMEVKQKRHFHPQIIKFWGLERVETQLRQAAEFYNLYSKWRGTNRFAALLRVFDALAEMPGVRDSGVELPARAGLRRYVESGRALGNPTLEGEVKRTGDGELSRILEWSKAVSRDIADNMGEAPPFTGVREALETMSALADMIVVSQTPEEALVHEWKLHGLERFVKVIAGQELGSKAEHLEMATRGRWTGDKVLMIGDALGDRRAAEAVNACFFPVIPGQEEHSWRRLNEEAFERFATGSYRGEYEDQLIQEFESVLPENPPWKA